MRSQLTLDMSAEDECRDRRWLALTPGRSSERNDTTSDAPGHCRFGWLYARGNEVAYVTKIEATGPQQPVWRDKHLVDWPRCQRREGTDTGEMMTGDITTTLGLIARRGFRAELQAPARSERDVTRRRVEPRAVSATQPTTVCCVGVATALAA